MSASISVGRRSPGKSTAQPPASARCEQSEAAARTDRVERLLGPRQRRVDRNQRRRVGAGDQPALDQLAGSRHGRPVDSRGGAALAIGAQAVDLELDRTRIEAACRRAVLEPGDRARADPVGATAGGEHRLDPRQDQELAGIIAFDDLDAQPKRVANLESRGGQPAHPSAAEAHLALEATRPARADGDRRRQGGVGELASGR